MAPRKGKLSKDSTELQTLLEEYAITFKGPVPPREWPIHLKYTYSREDKLKHRFSIFREIWGNRYDALKCPDDERRGDHKELVNDLRKAAYKMRDKPNANEATWRDKVEQRVLKRFQDDVICSRFCGDEKCTSRYQADPLTKDIRDQLEYTRSIRKPCRCEKQPRPFSSRDHEREPLFEHALSHEIEHSSDGLNQTSVPMRPDRVIGLTLTNRTDLKWNPVKGIEMTCPFLLIEAKKEKDAPGFRSVERQTAFPIRTLLKLQKDLLAKKPGPHEPPLVWFFAYQGEEWRLYAGTLVDADVCIYDLWHGTIESQDGSLQLLQIVDYIWTWARDIFRPQMKECLRAVAGREPTPASLVQYHTSPSVISNSTACTQSERIALESLNSPLHEMPNARNTIHQTRMETSSTSAETHGTDSPDHHTLHLWLTELHRSSPLNLFANIRHSNIVSFSFCLRRLSDFAAFCSAQRSSLGRAEYVELLSLYELSILVAEADLYHFVTEWTGKAVTSHRSAKIVRTTLFYHTYMRSTDWQIVREIYCIIWPSRLPDDDTESLLDSPTTPTHTVDRVDYQCLERSFRFLKQSQGSRSLFYALNNHTSFPVFRQCQHQGEEAEQEDSYVQWESPEKFNIPGARIRVCIEILQNDAHFGDREHGDRNDGVTCSSEILLNPMENDLEISQILPGLPDVSERGACVVIKPTWWPARTPKFCMFVFLRKHCEDSDDLANQLEEVLRSCTMFGAGNIFGAGNELGPEDRAGLKAWLKWLCTLKYRLRAPGELEI